MKTQWADGSGHPSEKVLLERSSNSAFCVLIIAFGKSLIISFIQPHKTLSNFMLCAESHRLKSMRVGAGVPGGLTQYGYMLVSAYRI